ncbi:hypothetical protein FPZ12_028095 [Amycolatopsis acidicola]|uniref:DoxX family protein n=1 Tax=Amycolatopsis acidicola TaxID=2596893 RepID=A0A5N0UVV6_9PSEU|nr:hypothetical protein [Amycolatopsis acidicola]KAA9156192.1 hypothetical protein FPZ12_028095 [Amycolatopsis acidicola]
MGERWGALPVWARWLLAVYLAGFLEGTGAHLLDLARSGLHAYDAYPLVFRVFFVCLVFLDPLTAVLIALARRAGVWLAAAVMVVDVGGNWIGNAGRVGEVPLFPVGLGPITLFGLFVFGCTVPLHRVLTRELYSPKRE